MALSQIEGDVYVNGNLSTRTFTLPSAVVADVNVASLAAIDSAKLQQQRNVTYSQDSTTNANVERKVIHIVRGATGTVLKFSAGSVTIAAAAGNAVIDLLKNGTTILTAPITLDSANTNYLLEDAPGFTSTALVAGDVLEFKLTSAAATQPKGVFCRLVITELAQ